jgi:hypothetical protein
MLEQLQISDDGEVSATPSVITWADCSRIWPRRTRGEEPCDDSWTCCAFAAIRAPGVKWKCSGTVCATNIISAALRLQHGRHAHDPAGEHFDEISGSTIR